MGSNGSKTAAPIAAPPRVEADESISPELAAKRAQMEAERERTLERVSKALEKKGDSAPDLLRNGRYRIAGQETTEAFYAQQPSKVKMDINVPEELVGMSPKQIKQYLSDTEGLNLGKHQMKELSQLWRLLLASDAVQHGIDAGVILGAAAAATVAAFKPAKRHPLTLMNYFMGGYAVGVICFPMSIMAYEQYYTATILRQERDMFTKQRADFYHRVQEAGESRDPTAQ